MQRLNAERFGDELTAFVARIRDEARIPGIAVAVSVAGRRFAACAGVRSLAARTPLTIADRFHIGSATTLLAIVALESARRGVLDLKATLGEYLPELAGTLHGGAIRVEHLLSHTSGYRGVDFLDRESQALDWDRFVAYLAAAPRFFEPGTVFSYEHTESVVLARIVERATGKPSFAAIDDLLAKLAIAPRRIGRDELDAGRHELDRESGAFRSLEVVPEVPAFWLPAFSRYTLCLGDLLSIAEAVLGASSRDLVSAATLELLCKTAVRLPPTIGGPLRELLPVAFGLGAAEFRDGFHGSSGLTLGQCLGLRFDRRTGICVAVGLNAMAPHLRDFVLAAVCRELTGRTQVAEQRRFPFDLGELEGIYLGPGNGFVRARLIGERLTCEIGAETTRRKLEIDLALDDDGALVLRSPAPHLSLGFFREPRSGALGLMLGLSAYKRISANRA